MDLKLGNNLNAVQIKEGYDVYFECKIKSNPREQKITWLKNVSIIDLFLKIRNWDLWNYEILQNIKFEDAV